RDYLRFLRPGAHWIWGFGLRVELVAVTDLALKESVLEHVAKDPQVWEDLVITDLRDHERALAWVDGRLRWILAPGQSGFWKTNREVRVDVIDARAVLFDEDMVEKALKTPGGAEALQDVVVPAGATGLLVIDEKIVEELAPGRYALWKNIARARVDVVDLREQAFEVTGQEVLTKDKATVRLNLVATFRVEAPRTWLGASTGAQAALYRELQLAARKAVGARTLDELLSAKDQVSVELRDAIAQKAKALGAVITDVGLKDVILPGEMRTLMNQVLEAEKRAQANLIARREETAATRALLNTAKLYADNPALLRLKELETAEKVAEKVAELRVGSADELLTRMLPKKG
ncbi:MAG: slipin family protein, partial [Planctomycetota bacterium]